MSSTPSAFCRSISSHHCFFQYEVDSILSIDALVSCFVSNSLSYTIISSKSSRCLSTRPVLFFVILIQTRCKNIGATKQHSLLCCLFLSSVAGLCAPDPCQHGTCQNNATDYACVCDPGYSGTNCTIGYKPSVRLIKITHSNIYCLVKGTIFCVFLQTAKHVSNFDETR